ncbi:PREDICTED: uncharacterized protein LOC101296194 [Fragaria vesca subsp. vesca]
MIKVAQICDYHLDLENVRDCASSGSIHGPVSLPSLKTMSLKDVTFLDDEQDTAICAFPSLVSGSPCIEHFLKHVHIFCKGLKRLLSHNCLQSMENSFYTPNLESFEFGGYLKAKIHFTEAPANLVNSTIRVSENLWPIEYYSAMRDFLGSFDCSKKVKIHIEEPEGVIIPEHCRTELSPPLSSIKQLQLYFSPSLGEREYCLRQSLIWMAPSAEILPFLDHDDDDDSDDFDDDDYNIVDDDNGIDDDNGNVDNEDGDE